MHEKKYVEQNSATVWRYIIGFILSIVFTLLSYVFVVYHLMHGWPLLITLGIFVTLQLAVQLFFFLHLGKGSDTHWNWMALASMLAIVLIVVVGSLWIMNNLNYNMMTPHDMNEYMLIESNKGF